MTNAVAVKRRRQGRSNYEGLNRGDREALGMPLPYIEPSEPPPPMEPEDSGRTLDEGAPGLRDERASPEERSVTSTRDIHRRLREQIEERRMDEEIAAMRQELEGGARVDLSRGGDYVGIPKRAAVVHEEQPFSSKLIRLATPPYFEGKNIQELTDYETGHLLYLAGTNVPKDAHEMRINVAASYLRGAAAKAFLRNKEPVPTWDAYIDFLRDLIADPANRMATATLKLQNMRQSTSQSARDVLDEIETLEADIPEDISEEQRKAWHFLNSLAPRLRSAVMRENREINSRVQVLAAAQRQEELDSGDPRRAPQRQTTTQTRRGGSARYAPRQVPVREEREEVVKRSTTKVSEPTRGCWTCGGKDHKAFEYSKCPGSAMNKSKSRAGAHVSTRRGSSPPKN